MATYVLIPAHNEESSIAASVASVAPQVDRVIVISDNSTDETQERARQAGATAWATEGNVHRKAGALNQALARLADTLTADDLVLVMDADTVLNPDWTQHASAVLHNRPEVGGVGAVFHAPQPTSYLTLCQRLEWERYAEETERTGKTFVMSGTAALIRWEALEDVRARFGHWYDTETITEDSRLSLDLQMCGWELASPADCAVTTEVMPTWQMLWLQRRRWYLGAMQNVADLGWNRITRPYWRQQAMLALSVSLMGLYLTLTVLGVVLNGLTVPAPLWLAVGALFAAERVATVWDESWRRRVFAALVLPELAYALVLQSAYLGAVVQKITRSAGVWAHVQNRTT